MNLAGVSLGLIAAPPLATWIAVHYGWRSRIRRDRRLGPRVDPGVECRLRAWRPRRRKRSASRRHRTSGATARLWAFVAANALTMFGLFAVDELDHASTLSMSIAFRWRSASRYVLAAFTFAAAGGFVGGWLSARQIARGATPRSARFRVCLAGAALSLVTAAIPAAQHAGLGRGRNFAELLRRFGHERKYLFPAARYFRPRACRVQHRRAGGILWSNANVHLAVDWRHDRCASLDAAHVGRHCTPALACAVSMDGENGAVKERIKRWFFRLLGKDPEAVVVSFVTGDAALCSRMIEEVRALVPDRRHFVATPENWPELRRELRGYRIGLAPVMLTRESDALRRGAYRLAPRKILAYNSRLERHHLRPESGVLALLARRAARSDLSAPLVVAVA